MHPKRSRDNAPQSHNEYYRTFNHAIDLVNEAIAHAKKYSVRQLAAVVLKPTRYKLYRQGIEALMGKPLPEEVELTMEGVKIIEGSRGMIDSIRLEYVENKLNPNVFPKINN